MAIYLNPDVTPPLMHEGTTAAVDDLDAIWQQTQDLIAMSSLPHSPSAAAAYQERIQKIEATFHNIENSFSAVLQERSGDSLDLCYHFAVFSSALSGIRARS